MESNKETNYNSGFKVMMCINIALIILIAILGFRLIDLENKLHNISVEQSIELDRCPMCLDDVSINTSLNKFYIKCNGCGLSTGYFESKGELIEYWNVEPDE